MSAVTSSSRHLTASMVVVNTTGRVLLVHHNASGMWVFPGGHLDPDEAPHEAAIREVHEETGVKASLSWPEPLPGLRALPVPFRVDEHRAPPKPDRPGKPAEPAHTHIDLLFVGTADSTADVTVRLDEVSGVRWVHVDDLHLMNVRAEVLAVARAARAFLATDLSPTS